MRRLILLVLLTATLAAACRTPPAPTPAPLPATAMPEPTPAATALPPTPTVPPTAMPEPTPAPTATPIVSAEDQALQEATFEAAWEIVRDFYVDPAFNGVDWDAVGQQYRRQIAAGLPRAQFPALMQALITELADHHSRWLSADDVAATAALKQGNAGQAGVGLQIAPRPAANEALVTWAIPGNPAAEAGIRARDRLLAVNGEPVCCDERGALFDQLRGVEGESLTLTVQSPGQAAREVVVAVRPIQLASPVEVRLLPDQIGLIALHTFLLAGTAEQFEAALRELHAQVAALPLPEAQGADGEEEAVPLRLRGLILDLRGNGGGFHNEMEGVLALFTFGELGGYRSRTQLEPLNLAGRDVLGSQTLPLVVLVGEATNSSGELLAGLLQERERAQIVGGATRANVETLFAHDLPDGSQLWLAEERFVPLSGARWEETGIVPDVLIGQAWDGFVESADDEALQAALETLKP